MQPLAPAILLRMTGRDALDLNTEAQPPDGQLAQAIERVRGRQTSTSCASNRRKHASVLRVSKVSSRIVIFRANLLRQESRQRHIARHSLNLQALSHIPG